MIQFFETQMGKIFFTSQLPNLITALDRIANAMEQTQDKEMIRKVISHLQKEENLTVTEQIQYLSKCGISNKELVALGYSKEEIEKCD